MHISKQEFQKIFDSVIRSLDNKINMENLLKRYADENGMVSPDKAAIFAYIESVNYSQQLIYSLFSELLLEER